MDESVVQHLELNEISQVLARAAQILSERGLHKCELFDLDPFRGSVCIQGAIIAAIHAGDARDAMLSAEQQQLFMRALHRVRTRIGGHDIADWNDVSTRTQYEAVTLLASAAVA